ncbi:reverse transcriptase domain-containing protein [Tanacetum coccineum]
MASRALVYAGLVTSGDARSSHLISEDAKSWVKYTGGSFVGKDLTWWNSQIHTPSREASVGMSWEDFKNLTREEFCLVNEMQKLETELVPHLVTPENKRIERYIYGLAPQICGMVAATEPETIQKAVQKAGTLTDEAIRNGSLKKNTEKRGTGEEPSRDRNVKDDNKRSRTGNAFATTANLVRREYTDTTPKCTNCNLHHSPKSPCRACFSCNRLGHLAKDCRLVPRMVNLVNARNPTAARGACFECGGTDHFKAACLKLNQAQRPGGGRPNQVVAIDGGQGRRNNGNRAREEASPRPPPTHLGAGPQQGALPLDPAPMKCLCSPLPEHRRFLPPPSQPNHQLSSRPPKVSLLHLADIIEEGVTFQSKACMHLFYRMLLIRDLKRYGTGKAGDKSLEARGEDTFLIIAHNVSAALPCTSGELCSNLEKNRVTLNSELLDLFSGETNKFRKLVVEMKAIQEAITTGTILPKTDREILVEVTKSTNRVHIAGVGTKLAGTPSIVPGRN